MSLITNLSVTSRWLQYNGKINNITQPTLQIYHTDQLFFQSPTSQPFYASRRRDWLARGTPTLLGVTPLFHLVCHVPNLTNIHYISLNGQRKMLYYKLNHIFRDTGLFKLEGREFEKLLFYFYFLNLDISFDNKLRSTKSWILIDEIHMQGTVSHILDMGLSFDFIKCRRFCLKKSPNSSRILA